MIWKCPLSIKFCHYIYYFSNKNLLLKNLSTYKSSIPDPDPKLPYSYVYAAY